LAAVTAYGIGVAAGQTWSSGVGLQLVGGSLANIGALTLALDERDAGGAWLAGTAATPQIGTSMVRASVTRVIDQATAAQVDVIVTIPLNVGAAIDCTIRVFQPNCARAPSDVYTDALTQNDNYGRLAASGGDLIAATGAGVDAFLAAAPGLRDTGKLGAAGRAPHDPTWGQYAGVTTDATPTVFASAPIAEGKAYRFRATIAAAQWGGAATEKMVYDITGIVSRDIGGNVVVVSTTTTVSEVTATCDCVAQANTTAQTLELKATGKAACRIAWVSHLRMVSVGLMAAA